MRIRFCSDVGQSMYAFKALKTDGIGFFNTDIRNEYAFIIDADNLRFERNNIGVSLLVHRFSYVCPYYCVL